MGLLHEFRSRLHGRAPNEPLAFDLSRKVAAEDNQTDLDVIMKTGLYDTNHADIRDYLARLTLGEMAFVKLVQSPAELMTTFYVAPQSTIEPTERYGQPLFPPLYQFGEDVFDHSARIDHHNSPQFFHDERGRPVGISEGRTISSDYVLETVGENGAKELRVVRVKPEEGDYKVLITRVAVLHDNQFTMEVAQLAEMVNLGLVRDPKAIAAINDGVHGFKNHQSLVTRHLRAKAS